MLVFAYLFAGLFSPSLSLVSHSQREKHAVGFSADPSINAAGIFSAAKSSAKTGNKVLAMYPSSPESGMNVKILGDWENLNDVSAIYYIADMDVDCDGVDFQCPNNPDGQSGTSFGALSATRVPFYVLPLSFHNAQASNIHPNALGAIICNGKMFYGIFGDEDADDPEVIGEVSILMAQTCFPNAGLDGGTGHTSLDVLYVVFGQQVPSGVGEQTINIPALKTLGDQQAMKLAKALGV